MGPDSFLIRQALCFFVFFGVYTPFLHPQPGIVLTTNSRQIGNMDIRVVASSGSGDLSNNLYTSTMKCRSQPR